MAKLHNEKNNPENIFYDDIKDVLSLITGGAIGYSSAIMSFFRLPTFIRRVLNEQTMLDKKDEDTQKYYTKTIGEAVGIMGGLYTNLFLLTPYILNSANINPLEPHKFGYSYSEENYIPLAIWTITNVISSGFELLKKKRNALESKV